MRGMAQDSLDLIEAARVILEEIQPATVRAVCYRVFTQGLIDSMAKNETAKVLRLLVKARETGAIPWEHIVDETREAERISAWKDLADYSETILRAYRKNFWALQPECVEVWSEKGTVRGTLAPVLRQYAVTFRVMHGFGSATTAHDVAEETGGLMKPLRALYVGDYDPSGLYMSEVDLPGRMERYRGNVEIKRLALTRRDGASLTGFAADTKRGDPRYGWFVENHGPMCWELDAMSPPVLRRRVEAAIRRLINVEAWEHCRMVEEAERESLKRFKWA
jgi:hypothetical protein